MIRTRARARKDRMSERELMRTPDSNGPVADLKNGVIGSPNHAPDDFVGFDPNDIENVNASGYHNAFNQFLTQQKVLDHIQTIVDSNLLDLNHIFEDDELLTELVTMELREDHRARLESQKTFTSKKSSIAAQIVSTLQPTSSVFDDFLDLELEFKPVDSANSTSQVFTLPSIQQRFSTSQYNNTNYQAQNNFHDNRPTIEADLGNALSAVRDKMVWATQQLQSSLSVENSQQLIGLVTESCKAIAALQQLNTQNTRTVTQTPNTQ